MKRRVFAAFVLSSFAVLAFGAQDIPLNNWTAPSTWTPARSGSISVMAELSNPLPFFPIDPCRIADTRGFGFTGAYGPPALAPSGTRNFTIAGQCGIPSNAKAV